METYDALRAADEVRTFPSISMPPATFKVHTGKTSYSKQRDLLTSIPKRKPVNGLPGLLRNNKSSIGRGGNLDAPGNIFTGFNNVAVKLDVKDIMAVMYDQIREKNALRTSGGSKLNPIGTNNGNNNNNNNNSPAVVDLAASFTTSAAHLAASAAISMTKKAPDPAMEELRNYVVLMDKYSMHNFLIYEGHTLRDTPEFQSFQRTYQYKWGAISSIIYQLEEFLNKNDVKLAIINGPRLFEYAKLNLPVLSKAEMYGCITNIEQIEAVLDSGLDVSRKQLVRMVVKIQSIARMYIARQQYRMLRFQMHCATMVQAAVRRMLTRIVVRRWRRDADQDYEQQRKKQLRRMREWWKTRRVDTSLDRTRLIVFIPTLSVPQYVRLGCENLAAMQNSSISAISMLLDPSVHMIYIVPLHLSAYQQAYHNQLLTLLGTSTLPKRLQFITPEAITKLPEQMSLSQQLWYSAKALKRLAYEVRKYSNAHIFARTLGWAEKRISKHLNIPLFSADPLVAETFRSRSYFKNFLMEAGVNIPIGAHDIYSVDDLILALTRLISSNLGIMRWIIRLNCDFNQESTLCFDVEKLPLIAALRTEQLEMLGHATPLAAGSAPNTSAWYSKPIQLSVRKRILVALKKEFIAKARICRRDMFAHWEEYAKMIRVYGAVIEAEPIEKIGNVLSTVFINPLGEFEDDSIHGFDEHIDDRYQVHSYSYPQEGTPAQALHGVTQALARKLHKEHKVIGHVTIHFVSFWDALDRQPRLWGKDIHFGFHPVFGSMTAVAALASPLNNGSNTPAHAANGATLTMNTLGASGKAQSTVPMSVVDMPLSLIPSLPADRCHIYIPLLVHQPLTGTHDEDFFKMCRMRAVAFDIQSKVGALFFLPDSTVGGTLSLLCIHKTRIQTLELVINTLSFVMRNFGLDKANDASPKRCETLQKICTHFKKVLKAESGGDLSKSKIIDIGR